MIPAFYLPIYARGPAGGTLAEKWCHRPKPNVPVAALGDHISRFCLLFERSRVTQKNNDFSNRLKLAKMAESIDLGASKA